MPTFGYSQWSFLGWQNVQCSWEKNSKGLILIWDTGASFVLTPFQSDFIYYVEADIPVKDVTKINRVIGIGTTLHKFQNYQGKDIFLTCVSYHLLTTDVRLLYPQNYHQMHGGHSWLSGNSVEVYCKSNEIEIPIRHKQENLPIVLQILCIYSREEVDWPTHPVYNGLLQLF